MYLPFLQNLRLCLIVKPNIFPSPSPRVRFDTKKNRNMRLQLYVRTVMHNWCFTLDITYKDRNNAPAFFEHSSLFVSQLFPLLALFNLFCIPHFSKLRGDPQFDFLLLNVNPTIGTKPSPPPPSSKRQAETDATDETSKNNRLNCLYIYSMKTMKFMGILNVKPVDPIPSKRRIGVLKRENRIVSRPNKKIVK